MSTKDVTDAAVANAAIAAKTGGETTLAVLERATGQPQKVCLRAIERAVKRGFVECGVSAATAWATPAGAAIAVGPCNCGNAECGGCYPA